MDEKISEADRATIRAWINDAQAREADLRRNISRLETDLDDRATEISSLAKRLSASAAANDAARTEISQLKAQLKQKADDVARMTRAFERERTKKAQTQETLAALRNSKAQRIAREVQNAKGWNKLTLPARALRIYRGKAE